MAIAGATYLLWWFLLEWLLPNSFNPLLSGLAASTLIFAALGLSYVSSWARRNASLRSQAGAWAITLHYFYLLYFNGGDAEWVVGAYITVIAVNLGMLSSLALLSYSVFVFIISIFIVYKIPALRGVIFFPGLLTILGQANLVMRSRLSMIKSLAERIDRFQLLFNAIFEGILVHERGVILNVNDSLTRIMGYTRAEMIGQNLLDLIVPEEKAAVAEKLAHPDSTPYQTRGLSKGGNGVDIEVRSKYFLYNNRTVRLRDEFISIASHKLRTPISTLKLQTQLIEHDLRSGQLQELSESTLDVSRISAGRFILEPGEVDLPALVRETVETFAP